MKRPLAMVLAAAATFFLTAANHIPELYPPYGVALQTTFNSGDAVDTSPSRKAGTLANGAVVTAGNRYATLDGTNDCIQWSDSNDPVITGTFSISVWFKPSSPGSAYRLLWAKYTSGSRSFAFGPNYATNNMRFTWSDNGTSDRWYDFVSTIPSSGWHHAVVVYAPSNANGQRVKYYLDGASVATTGQAADANTAIFNSTSDLLLGAYNSAASPLGLWKGDLDDFRIYNGKDLSSAEVQQLYSAGRP